MNFSTPISYFSSVVYCFTSISSFTSISYFSSVSYFCKVFGQVFFKKLVGVRGQRPLTDLTDMWQRPLKNLASLTNRMLNA